MRRGAAAVLLSASAVLVAVVPWRCGHSASGAAGAVARTAGDRLSSSAGASESARWSDLDAALAAWSGFPASGARRPSVVLELDKGAGWRTGEAKGEFTAGDWQAPEALPPTPTAINGYPVIPARQALDVLRAEESSGLHGAPRLHITEVSPAVGTFITDRGPRELPGWRVRFAEANGPFLVMALAAPARWQPPRSTPDLDPYGADHATPGPGATELTVTFVGAPEAPRPCGVDYRAQVEESGNAVAYRVVAVPRAQPVGAPGCYSRLLAISRQMTVHLAAPLAGRVLLNVDDQGRAVPVDVDHTPAAPRRDPSSV